MGVSVKRFIWWDMAIVALTSAFFTALGYYSGQGYGFLQRSFGYGVLWLAGFFVLFLVVTYIYNRIAQRFTRRIRQYADGGEPGAAMRDCLKTYCCCQALRVYGFPPSRE